MVFYENGWKKKLCQGNCFIPNIGIKYAFCENLSLHDNIKSWINVISQWWTEERRKMEWQEWLTDEHWWRREDERY